MDARILVPKYLLISVTSIFKDHFDPPDCLLGQDEDDGTPALSYSPHVVHGKDLLVLLDKTLDVPTQSYLGHSKLKVINQPIFNIPVLHILQTDELSP